MSAIADCRYLITFRSPTMIVETLFLMTCSILAGKSIAAWTLKNYSAKVFIDYWNIFMSLSLLALIGTLEFGGESGILLSTLFLIAGLSALTRAGRL